MRRRSGGHTSRAQKRKTRRGFDPDAPALEDRARTASLYWRLLHAKVRQFNPKYKEAEGALVGEFQRLNASITGNRELPNYLRNQAKFFSAEDKRELDLMLIDYGDVARPREQWRNVYEVTEGFYVHNGRYGTREEIVFLINGIPVLVIECKNATKDEAIALGIAQIRRYHDETPEVMTPEMIFTATEAIGFSYGVTCSTIRRNIFTLEERSRSGTWKRKSKRFAMSHISFISKRLHSFGGEGRRAAEVYPATASNGSGPSRSSQRALDPKRHEGLYGTRKGAARLIP